jgi:carboxyl-terminal processing protease
LSADDFRDFNDRAGGSFGGLGIQITADRGAIRVISPMDGTPAERAGIQPGDFITHIDGEPVFDMTLNQAVRRMRGRVGTRVRITVITEGSEPRELNLTRATVRVESVTHEIMGDGDQRIGFIRISDFGAVTTRQLREAITALQAKNVIGYVLDVRNNPGGYLTAAINVADSFLDAGQEIVSIRGRSEQVDRTNSRGADLIAGLPIVVLINNGSASASEIVAGAIQDNRRGIVMGSQSFGKGSVQQQMPLGDGTAIHLTIAHYYTPSGALIQGIGITPDVEVLQSRVEVIERRRRTAHTEETFRDALRAGATDDDDNAELTPAQRRARDYQLQRALDMVRAMSRLGLRPPLEEGDE